MATIVEQIEELQLRTTALSKQLAALTHLRKVQPLLVPALISAGPTDDIVRAVTQNFKKLGQDIKNLAKTAETNPRDAATAMKEVEAELNKQQEIFNTNFVDPIVQTHEEVLPEACRKIRRDIALSSALADSDGAAVAGGEPKKAVKPNPSTTINNFLRTLLKNHIGLFKSIPEENRKIAGFLDVLREKWDKDRVDALIGAKVEYETPLGRDLADQILAFMAAKKAGSAPGTAAKAGAGALPKGGAGTDESDAESDADAEELEDDSDGHTDTEKPEVTEATRNYVEKRVKNMVALNKIPRAMTSEELGHLADTLVAEYDWLNKADGMKTADLPTNKSNITAKIVEWATKHAPAAPPIPDATPTKATKGKGGRKSN